MQRCLGCMREFGEEFDVCPYCGYVVGAEAASKNHLAPDGVLHEKDDSDLKVLSQSAAPQNTCETILHDDADELSPDLMRIEEKGLQDIKMMLNSTNDSPPVELDQGVLELYFSINEDVREKLFFGGVESARQLLTDLLDCAKTVWADAELNDVFQIYYHTWIRGKLLRLNPSRIKKSLCQRFRYIPTNVIKLLVDRSLNVIYENDPILKNQTDVLNIRDQWVAKIAEKNTLIQDQYLSDPEYGLVESKPVFVAGYKAEREYLSHLTGEHGEPLRFERMGSVSLDEIPGPVDEYQAYLTSGEEYETIYICLYGTSNSTQAPQGFQYKTGFGYYFKRLFKRR